MKSMKLMKRGLRLLALGGGAAAGAYAAYAGATWYRYGHARPSASDEKDELLDGFMPAYEVVERHQIRVDAPADVTLAVAKDLKLLEVPVARAIFKGRELLLGSARAAGTSPQGLLDEVQSLGWGVLAEVPGREIVLGAVTKPWEANVTFRSIPPGEFAAFAEPDYVKIAWTLRADPIDSKASMFRTETRAVATDPQARQKFRKYWALLSPGIALIRRATLGPVKKEAERRAGVWARS